MRFLPAFLSAVVLTVVSAAAQPATEQPAAADPTATNPSAELQSNARFALMMDFDPGNVVRLSPYRTSEHKESSGTI